jgi:peptide-methionine (S)-S-oxide reductase
MNFFRPKQLSIPSKKMALPGREEKMPVPIAHFVNKNSLSPPFPDNMEVAMFGMGCFWGAERKFWVLPGVYSTAVGYSGGFTPNPNYEEVCSGHTGHNEVVKIIFDPNLVSYNALLKLFWESHNPTQGMRQGNDIGTQYRSAIYTFSDLQITAANASSLNFSKVLTQKNFGNITTEIITAEAFYYAEEYHQQYLAKNPSGYCGIGGTGAILPSLE